MSCVGSWVEIQIEIYKGWCTANTYSVYNLTFRALALRQRKNWFRWKANVCWEALRQLVEEKLRKLSASQSRECGYRIEISICLSHFNKQAIQHKHHILLLSVPRRKYMLRVLKQFPQRFLQTFDRLGTKTDKNMSKTFVRRTDLIWSRWFVLTVLRLNNNQVCFNLVSIQIPDM